MLLEQVFAPTTCAPHLLQTHSHTEVAPRSVATADVAFEIVVDTAEGEGRATATYFGSCLCVCGFWFLVCVFLRACKRSLQ